MSNNLVVGTWRLHKMFYHDGNTILYSENDDWEQYVFEADGMINIEHQTGKEIHKRHHFEEWIMQEGKIVIMLSGKPVYTVESLTPEELVLKSTSRAVKWGYKRMK